MCDAFIPDYAYKEQHICCYNCGKTANIFMIDGFIDSNYSQAKTLNSMKFNKTETESFTDDKGNKQILTKIVGQEIPWFAENPSQIPLLIPVCNSCKDKESNKQYIHCHYGFVIFKMQKERFNSGSPYREWIKGYNIKLMNNIV